MGVLVAEVWADVLLIITIVLAGLYLLKVLLSCYAKSVYHKWISNPSTPLDVDSFVDTAINPPKYLKILFLQKLSVGDRKPSNDTVPLASAESPHVPGLQVTERLNPRTDGKKPKSKSDGATKVTMDPEHPPPLVIGTIRMGFGHHRIAYAACSWAMHVDDDNKIPASTYGETASPSASRTTYFHDLLNIDSQEADLIKATDAIYSKMSRLTSNIGGFVEALWGKAMLSGDGDALRISGLTAVHLRPLFDLPRDTPIIATHCYVALAAVAAGFKNVINLVIDNHAQWFVVVPGCLNLVQGPVNYQNFLKMGVDPRNIQLAGHWIPRDLVNNIPTDCERRIARIKDSAYKPRRILIPVGGAGAQRKFICQYVQSLKPLIETNRVQLFLNAGDHVHMKAAFQKVLANIGLKESDYDQVHSTDGVRAFRDNLLQGKEPAKNITLFSFEDYFPAVATTDILSRVADVLACKPSELAFYPVPKLMIRRVGDHEQYSALRAAELGDGTLEAREIEDCEKYMELFCDEGSVLLEQMNRSIVENNEKGIYDGCKNAVRIALERAKNVEGRMS